MRVAVIFSLIALIAYYGSIRPFLQKVPVPRVFLLLLTALLVVFGAFEARWQYLQDQGTAVVRAISGNPNGRLSCQRWTESLLDTDSASIGGKVYVTAPTVAHLKFSQCETLFTYIAQADKSTVNFDQTVALHILTHESVHVSGQTDEAVTECSAVQRDPITVRTLGGTDAAAKLVQSDYFTKVFSGMPDSYILKGCRIDPKFDTVAAKSAK